MYGEYTCLDCRATFDTPKRWVERHGLDGPPYEEWYGCPFCSGACEHTSNIENEDEQEDDEEDCVVRFAGRTARVLGFKGRGYNSALLT